MDILTDVQVEALLYGETSIELEGVFINAWYDCREKEKNIDIVKYSPHKEISLIANGMSPQELKALLQQKLEEIWK